MSLLFLKTWHLSCSSVLISCRDLPQVPPDLFFPALFLQLIIPHLRYTMEINVRARTGLVSEQGVFDQV